MEMNYKELLASMPPRALKAYEVWVRTHSIKETARIVGVSRATIHKWKKKYKWNLIEKERLLQTIEEDENVIEKIKDDQRKIVNAAIAAAVKQLKEGKLKARSFSDLVTLLKYRLELEGEFKDDVNVNINFSLAALHEELMKRRARLEGNNNG